MPSGDTYDTPATTPVATATDKSFEGRNDECATPGVDSSHTVSTSDDTVTQIIETAKSGINYCKQNPAVTLMVVLALGWQVLCGTRYA